MKNNQFIKAVSLILVVTFSASGFCGADPVFFGRGQKLAVWSAFEKKLEASIFYDASLRNSVALISQLLLEGDPDRGIGPIPLKHLESFISGRGDYQIIPGIDVSHVQFSCGQVTIPYRVLENGDEKEYMIKAASIKGMEKQELAGYEWMIAEKLAVKGLPAGAEDDKSVFNRAEGEEVKISGPINTARVNKREAVSGEEKDGKSYSRPGKISAIYISRVFLSVVSLLWLPGCENVYGETGLWALSIMFTVFLGYAVYRAFYPEFRYMAKARMAKTAKEREQILSRLKFRRGERAFRFWKTFLDDGNPGIAKTAIKCVARYGGSAAIDVLRTCIYKPGYYYKPAYNYIDNAIDALNEIGADRKIIESGWVRALDSPLPHIRCRAIKELALIRGEDAVFLVEEKLNDMETDARSTAVRVFSSMRGKAALDLVINAARDPDKEVRKEAAEAMGGFSLVLENSAGMNIFYVLLDDPSIDVRIAAVKSLCAYKPDRKISEKLILCFSENGKSLNDEKNSHIPATEKMFKEIITFSRKKELLKLVLAEAIGLSGREEGVALLSECLGSGSPSLKRTCAAALGILGDKKGCPALMTALSDENYSVRRSAALALFLLTGTDSFLEHYSEPAREITTAELRAETRSSSALVRLAALRALNALDEQGAIGDFVRLLDDKYAYVREEAASGVFSLSKGKLSMMEIKDSRKRGRIKIFAIGVMEEVNGEKALDEILDMTEDLDEIVREKALSRAVKLGAEADKRLKALEKAALSKKTDIAVWAVNNMAQLGTDAAFNALKRVILRGSDLARRKAAVQSLTVFSGQMVFPFLKRCLWDREEDIRCSAIQALGYMDMGETEALDSIMAVAGDRSENVRTEAVLALAAISDRRAEDIMLDVLKNAEAGDLKIPVLEYFRAVPSRKAVDIICGMLKDKESLVKMAAIRALEAAEDRKGLSFLKKVFICKEESVSIRSAAIEAFGYIEKQCGEQDGECLLNLINEENMEITKAVVSSLGKMRYPGAVTALVEIFRDDLFSLRQTAAAALGNIGSREAVREILPLALDPDFKLRMKALEVLDRCGVTEGELYRLYISAMKTARGDDLRVAEKGFKLLADGSRNMRLIGESSGKDDGYKNNLAEALDIVSGGRILLEKLRENVPCAEVRAMKLIIAGDSGDNKCFDPAAGYIHDPDEKVSAAALDSAEKLCRNEAQECRMLFAALTCRQDTIRKIAVRKIGRFSGEVVKNICGHMKPELSDDIVAMFDDGDQGLRLGILRILEQKAREEHYGLLIRGLAEALPEARIAAIKAIKKIKPEKAARRLYVIAKSDKIPAVRAAAVDALAEIKGSGDFVFFKSMLTDPDRNVRRAVFDAIARMGGPEAEIVILGLLEKMKPEENEEEQVKLLEVASGFRGRRAETILGSKASSPFERVRGAAVKALASFSGRKTVMAMIARLYDVNETRSIRKAAIRFMSAERPPEAREALRAVAEEEIDDDIRSMAVMALGRYKNPADGDLVAGVMRTGAYKSMVAAIEAMGNIGGEAVVRALCNKIRVYADDEQAPPDGRETDKPVFVNSAGIEKSGDSFLRWMIIKALDKCGGGDRETAGIFRQGLYDREHYVRLASAEALGKHGSLRDIRALNARRADSYRRVAEEAASAMRGIIWRTVKRKIPGRLTEEWAERLLLKWYVWKIAGVSEKKIKSRIVKQLERRKKIKILMALAYSPDPEVRRLAAEALGTAGDASCMRDIVRLVCDSDEVVRNAADSSIRKIGREFARPELMRKFWNPEQEVSGAAFQEMEKLGFFLSGAPEGREEDAGEKKGDAGRPGTEAASAGSYAPERDNEGLKESGRRETGALTVEKNDGRVEEANNLRSEIADLGNSLARAVGDDIGAGGKTFPLPIDRNKCVEEILAGLERVLLGSEKAAGLSPENEELKAGIEDKKKYLVFAGIKDALIRLADRAAAHDPRNNVIIALELDWIPGNGNRTPVENALQPLVEEIKRIGKYMKAMGFGGFSVITGSKNDLAGKILDSAADKSDLSNVVVLASRETVEGVYLDDVRLKEKNKQPFISGVDTSEVAGLYAEGRAVDVLLSALLCFILEAASGTRLPLSPANYEKFNNGEQVPVLSERFFISLLKSGAGNIIITVKDAEVFDIDVFKERCVSEAGILKSA
ncbi:MAG: HEAT repeat domain-containing protein [Candidatus Omnitrophota bacterium]